ncbi:MAG: pyroglutamyl-peptidase I [Sphaerochaeta sp.]|jgi:pyroglutamyl-peptidase|uniref:pyroglutamyl-peptidase I n=1 Tax=Sphaerochaeta sp. TaxID=1972642 RepID=UPI002FC5A2FD
MKVLLTAFEPIKGEAINPASEVMKQVRPWLGSAEVSKLLVPLVYGTAFDSVQEQMDRIHPDLILCLAHAPGRADTALIRTALNLADDNRRDNAGNQMLDRMVDAGGPAAYFTTVPVRPMLAAIHRQGIPASLSDTAGTFVCNHLLYALLHRVFERGEAMRCACMMIPSIPSQVVDRPTRASMSLCDSIRAVEAVIQSI